MHPDIHRCAHCGYEWKDDGRYYQFCPGCAAPLKLTGMSPECLTPAEWERLEEVT